MKKLILLFSVSILISCGDIKSEQKLEEENNSFVQTPKARQSMDAKEAEERADVSEKFRPFLVSYMEKIESIIKEYYLYEISDIDRVYTIKLVQEKYFDYSSKVYDSLLQTKLIELEYLAELAENRTLGEEDRIRIQSILWDLFYLNGECSEIIENICFLVLN